MIAPAEALANYVQPALRSLGLYSLDAERLLMGTAAIESNYANFVQFGGGPARGMFQMEPPTFHDITNRILAHPEHAALRAAVTAMATNGQPTFLDLTSNHLFAAAMARLKYFSVSGAIPTGLQDQANYWWHHYNGESPHGLKPADYLDRWNQHCAALYPGFA